jgi:hypothetical protein
MTPVNQEMLFYSTIDEQKYVAYFRPFRKGQYGRLMNELFYFHNPNMHFFYFNLTSVTKLLQRFGLRVCAAETIEAFEWITIHQRGQTPQSLERCFERLDQSSPRQVLSGKRNLIIVARK